MNALSDNQDDVAIELKEAGADWFTIYEAAEKLGGTWRDNIYPKRACDIPSDLDSYSFEPNPHWSRVYSRQPEIPAYLKDAAAKHELYEHIRFGTEILGEDFDRQSGTWALEADDGAVYRARATVLGIGRLARPFTPEIERLERYQGPAFHPARWDEEADLAGKRVAVVGTGASASQMVSGIVDRVQQLHLFQRTSPWLMPRGDRAFSDLESQGAVLVVRASGFCPSPHRGAYRRPGIAPGGDTRLHDGVQAYPLVGRLLPGAGPRSRRGHQRRGRRMRAADDMHRRRPQPGSRGGDLRHRFHVTDFLSYFRVIGLDGRELSEAWREGAEAYYGMWVSGFPNLVMLLGPNTGLGHNSVGFMIEAQVRMVRQALGALSRRDARFVDLRPAVHRDFNESLRERMLGSVWKSGCESWYLEDNGKNTTLWPGYTFDYRLKTRRLDETDFLFVW